MAESGTRTGPVPVPVRTGTGTGTYGTGPVPVPVPVPVGRWCRCRYGRCRYVRSRRGATSTGTSMASLVVDPTNATTSRVLHTIFDDSLDVRWTVLGNSSGSQVSTEAGSGGLPCEQHLRLSFGAAGRSIRFRSRSPVLGLSDASMGVRLTFLAKFEGRSPHLSVLPTLPACTAQDAATPSPSGRSSSSSSSIANVCSTALCVAFGALRPIPACEVSGPTKATSSGWRRFALPLHGLRQPLQELVLSSGSSVLADVLIDDLLLVSARPPRRVSAHFFDGPPPANAAAAASPAGARPRGMLRRASSSAGGPGGQGGPGWCRYMSSDYRPTHVGQRAVPRCRMANGDHLRGRWLQNCDPWAAPLRARPDLYAYGRAMPRVLGKFDFRVCHRSSFWELERAMQTLSWTWRPYDCRFVPFDGTAFDKWLGARSLVLIGDSLTGQLYYSLLFLLGAAVVRQVDHADGMRAGGGRNGKSNGSSGSTSTSNKPGGVSSATGDAGVRQGSTAASLQTCASGVADEGPSAFSEAHLSSGGRIVKVLGHTRYISELQHVERAPWLRFVRAADVVVLNVGHHYRSVDRTFANYEEMVRQVERSLGTVLKPSAHVVVRTTNVGHRGCENATRPLHDRLAAWERLADEGASSAFEWMPPSAEVAKQLEAGRGNPNSAVASAAKRDPFDWRAPALHERAWRQVFGRSATFRGRFSMLNVSFVDGRPDGHVAASMRYTDESARKANWGGGLDCLHYCYPGPADFWALALYNLLVRE